MTTTSSLLRDLETGAEAIVNAAVGVIVPVPFQAIATEVLRTVEAAVPGSVAPGANPLAAIKQAAVSSGLGSFLEVEAVHQVARAARKGLEAGIDAAMRSGLSNDAASALSSGHAQSLILAVGALATAVAQLTEFHANVKLMEGGGDASAIVAATAKRALAEHAFDRTVTNVLLAANGKPVLPVAFPVL